MTPLRKPLLNGLGIVIPARNAAGGIGGCLAAVTGSGADVLVVDGGSQDETMDLACAANARVLETRAGRGHQLAHGAHSVHGDWLLFLHADTVLQDGWAAAVEAHMAGHPGKAGHFRLAFDSEGKGARRLAALANWRARVFGLPYGDQGLLIRRDLYDALGGYRPLPLMEDVDLVRRIGRRRLRELPAIARTSAERYRRDGWVLRPLRNLFCLTLYVLGAAPDFIARIYTR